MEIHKHHTSTKMTFSEPKFGVLLMSINYVYKCAVITLHRVDS